MNYKVKIKSPNKIFIIDNRPIRSPFECNIEQSKIHLVKARIKFYGLSEKEYIIEPNEIIINKKEEKEYSLIPTKKEIKKVNSIVAKKPTINNNEKIKEDVKPIQKNIKKEEINVHKKQEVIKPPPILRKIENKTEPVNYIEQNIKCNTDDIEVTIEELTQKSNSILEKFLNTKDL